MDRGDLVTVQPLDGERKVYGEPYTAEVVWTGLSEAALSAIAVTTGDYQRVIYLNPEGTLVSGEGQYGSSQCSVTVKPKD